MPEIGVFGGSGLYTLLDHVTHMAVPTPYGDPSDEIAVGAIEGREVAFLPRHGRKHTLPPGAINYRANLWAMRELGVRQLIAPTAAGSLQVHIRPGDFVLCDQFVDRTWGRADSFVGEDHERVHAAADEPYCGRLRGLALEVAGEIGVPVHDRGTVVVIQGPRFSSRAESCWFGAEGWEVINMTQYPEVILARELGLCYLNISLITDYDAGVADDPSVETVTVAGVQRVFAENIERVRELILRLVPRLPAGPDCACCQSEKGPDRATSR